MPMLSQLAKDERTARMVLALIGVLDDPATGRLLMSVSGLTDLPHRARRRDPAWIEWTPRYGGIACDWPRSLITSHPGDAVESLRSE
ncbi:hypothetical protein [Microbacterium sp. W4I20]|uniref:hypothetical protein n=1 Tax=Microbacterium sp. W4I20 TaxID=3042262 RepID=UPI00277DD62F|nr:hypothetical protein [Microbacterium sp. W4I20]MDQ0728754.1 hypothetical protein [Microbacterium sp. W4I20]